MDKVSKNKNILLDILVVIIQGTLFIISIANLKRLDTVEKGISTIALSIYVLIWGILFLLCYYHNEKSYILNGLFWLCKHSVGHKEGKIAFFYFKLAILLGSIGLLYGFGILRQ